MDPMNLQVLPFAILALCALASCHTGPREACCTMMDLPARDGDRAILQVQGSTDAEFYVFDESGREAGHQSLNMPLSLQEGTYRVMVNHSACTVQVEAGKLLKCSTGTLIVSGNTSEEYAVTNLAGEPLGSAPLGKRISLFPDTVKVMLNNTECRVNVTAKTVAEIQAGTLVVRGSTGERYYVLDSLNRQLNYNRLGEPLAFLPGIYSVKVNNSTLQARVLPARATELITGCILVKGLTDERYYVSDTLGHALNYQALNHALALFPGKFSVQINNTVVTANVAAGDTAQFETGTLKLTGTGTEYYYVLDADGKELNYNSLNKSLSFFPAEYTIRLGHSVRKAAVVAGQVTSIGAFD